MVIYILNLKYKNIYKFFLFKVFFCVMVGYLPESTPLPLAFSSLHAMRVDFLATPYLFPPTVPATCVP